MRRRIGLPAIAVSAIMLIAAKPYSVRLSVRQCAPLAPQEIAKLGSAWATMSRFVERCSVPGPDRRVALTVDLIRLDKAYDVDYFATHQANLALPVPILRNAAGTAVGTLPEGFPIDPPGRLTVRFVKWRGVVPHKIELYQAGESAVSPHPVPPLLWNARTGEYQRSTRDRGR